ncbi:MULTISPECIES: type II 3-dehydroquinate dehydratase [Paraburkholderia]|jgi:3-dehydroquinate dehydratase-2|nr:MULTISPECIES: type II 3-dehydroquinate dehydratase [Paraburkholderia]AMV46399.1 3-dehydroquinate dehydratase [Paraburkholderia caribensis]MCO4876174.1 3-dehydroquinate dehydratase [Paraburkholderia caribensis]PTB27141.1 3-dehydroquinate dehydratase [Paraburkholderia caribensis]QLB64835.1 3-dehydroquinate dehydratase [Paraburkholderia caribensis]CAG9210657.1 3-dehydroquinate dehydratase [Paraburkholderia caribensis]
MTRKLYILNGSNLNMLGVREPHIYGTTTLADIEQSCLTLADSLRFDCVFRQTNSESELIDWIQEAFLQDAALIINPAGFSFGRIPVLDAVKLVRRPVVELHITNIHARSEEYRHSTISVAATAVICGAGANGYLLAIRAIDDLWSKQP